MSSIFNALNVGYSGLKSSQIAIDTTGHNIANAGNEYYTRQRTRITSRIALNTQPGDVGLGAKVDQIVRVHDEFVYKKLRSTTSSSEYHQLRQDILDEVSSYFPEIDKNGIYNGMQDFFNGWNDLSKNGDDNSLKINLAERTEIFTSLIKDTRAKLVDLQKELDYRLQIKVNEINRIGKDIAKVNAKINANESGGNHANDLRDKRDELEMALNKLVNISVSKEVLSSEGRINTKMVESGDSYSLNIGGTSFIDGATFHPIILDKAGSGSEYNNLYYKRQDYKQFDVTKYINDGEVGAILSLRGSQYNETYQKFDNGDIQELIDRLDNFSKSLIENVNNLYASHATTNMVGNVEINSTDTMNETNLHINEGSFYIKVYNSDGDEVAKKEIVITKDMTYKDIADAINKDNDDNADNDGTNDVDDYLVANASNIFQINMNSDKAKDGYTFAIEEKDVDNPTMFAGSLGLERFFDGSSAKDIRLQTDLSNDPTLISANTSPEAGNNELANSIVELQYKKVDFYTVYSQEPEIIDTFSGYFKMTASGVADVTASAHTMNETTKALLETVKNEFDSTSRVDIDEEMTNLMKYQTGYQASAKVITTIDQMIQTLLGMKQ